MPANLSLETAPSELAQIVESVFATMLGLEVMECQDPWFDSTDRMTSAEHLSGEWSGAVLFECHRMHACGLTGRFLSVDAAEPHRLPSKSTMSCAFRRRRLLDHPTLL